MSATILDAVEVALTNALQSQVTAIWEGDATEDLTEAGYGLPWIAVVDGGARFEFTSESRIEVRAVRVASLARGKTAAEALGMQVLALLDQTDDLTLAVDGASTTWCKPTEGSVRKESQMTPEDGEWPWRADWGFSVRIETPRAA